MADDLKPRLLACEMFSLPYAVHYEVRPRRAGPSCRRHGGSALHAPACEPCTAECEALLAAFRAEWPMLTWTRDETGRDAGTAYGRTVVAVRATAGETGPTLELWVHDMRAKAHAEKALSAALKKAGMSAQ